MDLWIDGWIGPVQSMQCHGLGQGLGLSMDGFDGLDWLDGLARSVDGLDGLDWLDGLGQSMDGLGQSMDHGWIGSVDGLVSCLLSWSEALVTLSIVILVKVKSQLGQIARLKGVGEDFTFPQCVWQKL